MSKNASEDILAFKARILEAKYSITFMDAIHTSLKRQIVSKEAAYVWKVILQYLKDCGL